MPKFKNALVISVILLPRHSFSRSRFSLKPLLKSPTWATATPSPLYRSLYLNISSVAEAVTAVAVAVDFDPVWSSDVNLCQIWFQLILEAFFRTVEISLFRSLWPSLIIFTLFFSFDAKIRCIKRMIRFWFGICRQEEKNKKSLLHFSS